MADIFVKICGLRDASNARVAIEAGASALGFILAPSRRQVTFDDVAAIRDELVDRVDVLPPFVAVVVNPTYKQLRAIEISGLFDVVQFSGDESPELVASCGLRTIKVLRLPKDLDVSEAERRARAWLSFDPPVSALLVEGHTDGTYGGTGSIANRELARAAARIAPVLLAGGLTPANVAGAIADVQPHGVDVSSGIERNGVKDPELIRQFIASARQVTPISVQPD